MSSRANYKPTAAFGADVRKDGDNWTLILVRDLRHSPAKVWRALTDPAELREWAPFDSDRNLDGIGPSQLTTVGTPSPHVTVGQVKRSEPTKLLEFNWGENDMRWELEPLSNATVKGGTRLTLWHNIGRKYISMGAAGWHICFDVLDHYLAGDPLGRIVAADAMNFEWGRLRAEYEQQFNNPAADGGNSESK